MSGGVGGYHVALTRNGLPGVMRRRVLARIASPMPIGVLMLETQGLRLMVFNPLTRRIERWTPPPATQIPSKA